LTFPETRNRILFETEKNLRTLIATARAHGSAVTTVAFGMPFENLHYHVREMESDYELRKRVISRSQMALQKSNDIIEDVSRDLNVSLIQFHKFQPSFPDSWVDQCHLDGTGCYEKALFVGKFLEKNSLIPPEFKRNAEPENVADES
jgi:hypothetical protein